ISMQRTTLIRSILAPMLAVVIAMAFAAMVRAEDAKAADTGTVSGTVLDKDGKPVSDAKVRVVAAKKRESGGATTAPSGDAKSKTDAAAEGTSDAQGKFTLQNVPVGDYTVHAAVKGQGSGREKVSVKAG